MGASDVVDPISRCRTQGKTIRTLRLFGHGDGRLFAVPLDHSVTSGPVASVEGMNRLVGQIAAGGADAVVLHKGQARWLDHRCFRTLSLITHLSAGTVRAPDPDRKYLVASVEEALRLGADAVSVHVNLGADDEAGQIADMAAVIDTADRWSVPVLAMVYPRGPRVHDPHEPELVAHAATLAADLGADIVKTVYTGAPESMAQIVRSCPVPIIVAGGARLESPASVEAYVREVLGSGVAGVAMGRNVFAAADPGAVVRGVAALLHPDRHAGLPGPRGHREPPSTASAGHGGRPVCAAPSPAGSPWTDGLKPWESR